MTMQVNEMKVDSLYRIYVENVFIGLGKAHKSKDKYFLKMEKVFYEK